MTTLRQRARQRGKSEERRVARIIGGKRIGPTGVNTADVSHDMFLIECKNTVAVPKKIFDWYETLKSKLGPKDDRVAILTVKRPYGKLALWIMSEQDFIELHGDVKKHAPPSPD